jgi:DNA-binding NarL/FixJ family response regulator
VIEIPADYKEIARRLRQREMLDDVPARPVKLAIRRTPAGPPEVRQLSPLSADLLDLCEEGLTVKEIAAEFFLRNVRVPGVPPERICLAGIEILRQQRLIGIAP